MGIPERKEREKEKRREDIVDAAQRVFFKRGLPAATMDEIAEKAELSKGTLYLYYSSKEDLYLAVMMRGLEILLQMFSEKVSGSEPVVVQLARLSETYIEFFRKHRNYFRMFEFLENPQFHRQVSEVVLKACAEKNHAIWRIVVGLIERGIKEKVLKPSMNPVEIAVISWSNATAMMRRIDHESKFWNSEMNINLEKALQTGNALLLESILSEEGKKQFVAVPRT